MPMQSTESGQHVRILEVFQSRVQWWAEVLLCTALPGFGLNVASPLNSFLRVNAAGLFYRTVFVVLRNQQNSILVSKPFPLLQF